MASCSRSVRSWEIAKAAPFVTCDLVFPSGGQPGWGAVEVPQRQWADVSSVFLPTPLPRLSRQRLPAFACQRGGELLHSSCVCVCACVCAELAIRL